jgi:hypothetical protein
MDYRAIEDFVKQKFAFMARNGNVNDFSIQPFSFSINDFALGANALFSSTFDISSNGDFVAVGVRCPVYIGANYIDTPNLRIKMTDTGSNEQISDKFVDINAVKDSVSERSGLVYPRIYSGRSSVNVEFQNGATALDIVRFSVVGVLVRAF